MASYLFTFNPENRDWGDARLEEWKEYVRKWEESGCYEEGWTCGNTKRILEGDRAFMVKVGKEPRGIIASGFVTQHAKEYENGVFVRIIFDVMLDPEQHIFPLRRLHRISQAFNWTPQKSGRTIS